MLKVRRAKGRKKVLITLPLINIMTFGWKLKEALFRGKKEMMSGWKKGGENVYAF